MKFALIGTAALIVATASGTARADWQYTKWGMTLDEVMAVAPADTESRVGQLSTGDRFVIGKYRAGPYNFESRLWFGKDGLYEAALTPNDDVSCSQLEKSLQATYERADGTGDATYGHFASYSMEFTQWTDAAKQDRVRLYFKDRGGLECVVVYRPVPKQPQKVDGL